ncbi:MAG: hypothetical protein J2P37_19925 [Ktedonobacteraceae bacterium]|nr:hypothetical protein [Ktedonobacteraceae bacterium]MBO0789948.1 hypothetical protein [Ktedonobacteraceae bacterium]
MLVYYLKQQDEFANVLEEHEQLLWHDKPGFFLQVSDVICFIFGAPLLLLGLYLCSLIFPLILHDSGNIAALILDLTFFAGPGLLLCSIPFNRYRTVRNTIYAITDRRLLHIISHGRSRQRHRTIKSYRREHLSYIERAERRGERGDLIFGKFPDTRFQNIAHVGRAEQILISAWGPRPAQAPFTPPPYHHNVTRQTDGDRAYYERGYGATPVEQE